MALDALQLEDRMLLEATVCCPGHAACDALKEEFPPPPPAPFMAAPRVAARGRCCSYHGPLLCAALSCLGTRKLDLAATFNAAHAEGCECCAPKESALKPGFWHDVGFGEQAWRPGMSPLCLLSSLWSAGRNLYGPDCTPNFGTRGDDEFQCDSNLLACLDPSIS